MKYLFILLIMCCSFTANAGDFKWFSSKIKIIYPNANGDFYLIFKDPNINCSRGDGYHFVGVGQSSVTREGVKTMLSTALTAATTGKSIAVYFDADSGSCSINRLYVKF